MKDFRVELKVCEGCGTLWLRPLSNGIYCGGCAAWLSEFPAPRASKRRGLKSTSKRGNGARGTEHRAERTAVCAGGAR